MHSRVGTNVSPRSKCRGLIRAGDTVVDVGANVGLWALGAARLAGPNGRVVAFEPVPRTHARLIRNVELNNASTVIVEQVALADVSGGVTLYDTSNGNSGGAGMLRRPGADLPFEARTNPLDRYCQTKAIPRIEFLKIDVEGAEPRVLMGAAALLGAEDAPIVMFEVDAATTQGLGHSPQAACGILRDHGYAIYEPRDRSLYAFSPEAGLEHGDLYALKPVRSSRARAIVHG